MKLMPSIHRCAFVLSAASFCILIAGPTKIGASPSGEPDLPTTEAAPAPRSTAEQIRLADDYFAGRGVTRDLKMAAYWYQRAAEAGDPGAQMQIGYLYETGAGVDRNLERAAKWYQLAASSGSLPAKVNLGIAYLWGIGVEKNDRLAFDLIHEAATHGSGLAACYLGDFYAFGYGVPQDKSQAEQWYRRGAALHDPIAEFDLATTLMNAKAGRQDLPTAAKLLRLSAAAGYVPAKHALGLLLVRNPELAQFSGEAAGLLNEAASAGNWRSSVLLGVMLRDGNGVSVDREGAYYHFRVATLQGGEEAARLAARDLDQLSAKLAPGRALALDFEANQWYQQHHFVLEFVEKEDGNRPGFLSFALVAPDLGRHAAELLTSPTE